MKASIALVDEGTRQLPPTLPRAKGPNVQGIVLLCGDVIVFALWYSGWQPEGGHG